MRKTGWGIMSKLQNDGNYVVVQCREGGQWKQEVRLKLSLFVSESRKERPAVKKAPDHVDASKLTRTIYDGSVWSYAIDRRRMFERGKFTT